MSKNKTTLAASRFHQFREWLAANGYAIDSQPLDFRVLMFRKKALPWTQVYQNCKNDRLVVAGPEAKITLRLFEENKG